MSTYKNFRKNMLNWWDKLISYWVWILSGIAVFVIVAVLFQDYISALLTAIVDIAFPSQTNFVSWGVRNPIGFILILGGIYILVFALVALIESKNILEINFIKNETKEKLEIIVENISETPLYDIKVILEDIFQNEKSIITESELKIQPGVETLIWKDNEWDEVDIFNEDTAIISLARYEEETETAYLFTSAGEIELPEGVCKVRASLISKDSNDVSSIVVFWVVIQFGEEIEEEETDVFEEEDDDGDEIISLDLEEDNKPVITQYSEVENELNDESQSQKSITEIFEEEGEEKSEDEILKEIDDLFNDDKKS